MNFTSRLLLITDGSGPVGRIRAGLRDLPPGDRRVSICFLGGHRSKEEFKAALEGDGIGDPAFVDFNRVFHEQAFSLKPDYLRWIYEWPRGLTAEKLDLHAAFRPSGARYSLWDLSRIAEKSPWKTEVYADLVRAVCLANLIGSEKWSEVWISLESIPLTQVVSEWARERKVPVRSWGRRRRISEWRHLWRAVRGAGRWLVQEIWKMRMVRRAMPPFASRLPDLKRCRNLIVVYFPILDEAALRESRFVDEYFRPLQAALEKRDRTDIHWLGLIVNRDGYDFRGAVQVARRIVEMGYRLSLMKEWTDGRDLLWVVKTVLGLACRAVALRKAARPVRFGPGLRVWPLLAGEWYESFAGLHPMMMLHHFRGFRRLLSSHSHERAFYPSEFQAWERAFQFARDGSGKPHTVGIQHTVVPQLHMILHGDRRENARVRHDPVSPYPDRLACVGDIPLRSLVEEGWPREAIFKLGPMRFPNYPSLVRRSVDWARREPRIVVALSTGLERSREMMEWTVEAARELSIQGLSIVFKNHPSTPMEDIVRNAPPGAENGIFRWSREPLPELLERAKGLVVLESSASLDGVACGCPVIVLRTHTGIDMNPLSGFTPLARFAYSAVDLHDRLLEVLRAEANPVDLEEARRFLEGYCDFPRSADEYLSRVEEALRPLMDWPGRATQIVSRDGDEASP